MLCAMLLTILRFRVVLQEAVENLFLGFGWLSDSSVPGLQICLENLRPGLRIEILHARSSWERFWRIPYHSTGELWLNQGNDHLTWDQNCACPALPVLIYYQGFLGTMWI
jgi:hypothetical protein